MQAYINQRIAQRDANVGAGYERDIKSKVPLEKGATSHAIEVDMNLVWYLSLTMLKLMLFAN